MKISDINNINKTLRLDEYKGYPDLLFVYFIPYLTWISLKLRLSGNAITVISGLVAMLGAILLHTESKSLIILGSFGYFFYYLLDYIDGAVARLSNAQSSEGNFLDMMMHIVAHVSYVTSISILFLNSNDDVFSIIIVLIIICASSCTLAKFGMAWFVVVNEKLSQNSIKPFDKKKDFTNNQVTIYGLIINVKRLFFHENQLILIIPICVSLNIIFIGDLNIFVTLFVWLGATLYPLGEVLEINNIVRRNKVSKSFAIISHNKLKQDINKILFLN